MKPNVWYSTVLLTTTLVGCNQQVVKTETAPSATTEQKGIQSVSKQKQNGRRMALVIGNAHYKHASELRSPVNDASDVAEALSSLNFDEVIDSYDVSKKEMEQSITRFVNSLRGDDMAVFYYSGHGMEINGRNYFIPVEANFDFDVPNAQKLEVDAKQKAVLADGIVNGMNKVKSSFVILDACRNNLLPPGSKSLGEKSRVAVKSIGGGSTPVAKNVDGEGDIITLYATKDGDPAFDGRGRNSLFTKHLLRGLKNPSLTVNQLAQQVTKGVKEESKQEYGEMQKPFVYGSLTEDRCLAPDCQAQAVAITTPPRLTDTVSSPPLPVRPPDVVVTPSPPPVQSSTPMRPSLTPTTPRRPTRAW